MARLIDADAAVKLLRGKCVAKYPLTFCTGLFAAADEISKLPTVDAVEVVRCRDCKHYKTQSQSVHREDKALFCCRSATVKVNPNDFCSSGERRDTE